MYILFQCKRNAFSGAIVDYLNYLKTLKFNTEPDYKKIRKIFISGIKDAGGSENDPIIFSYKKMPQKRKSDQKPSQSPKRKVGRGRKPRKEVKEETKNFEEDSNDEKVSKPINSEKASQSDIDDDEDIIEQSDEEVEAKKKGSKETVDKVLKKRGRPKKINSEMEEDNKLHVKEHKIESDKINGDEEQSGTGDLYEGYTEAMREIITKKLQNGKLKGRKGNKLPTVTDDTKGYTESMKELVLKKKERMESKKAVRGKKCAPSAASVRDVSSDTRGSRLRARKDICYGDQSDSD